MEIPIAVPDGMRGNWRVETFTVDDTASRMTNIRASLRPMEYVAPGTYKRLMHGRTVVMSNTPMEIDTNRPIMNAAVGDVLINGLGLGMVLTAILAKPGVTSVRVIEKHEEVIDLVAPTFSHDARVQVIHADALSYKPERGARFDACWHDIWDYICADNLTEMHTLHRRYGPRASWQGSWCRALVEDRARREKQSCYRRWL